MPSMAHNAIVVDLDKCIGCFGCEAACKLEHEVDLGIKWNTVTVMGPFGTFTNLQQYWLPKNCQQCADAPCQEVCPTGATYRDENNIVLVNAETCIGCQACIAACPYDCRTLNEKTNVVEKCTLCADRVAEGKDPLCVSVCCGEARYFGDLDDPESPASKALAAADPASIHQLPNTGNNPMNHYILSSRIAPWQE